MKDGRTNAPIYSCPDCGWDIEMPIPEVTSNDRDATNCGGDRSPWVAQSVLCQNLAVRRVDRVELLAFRADCRVVSR
jgi:hypothetical protein